MNERPFKFSILQLIGITAAVGGIIALFRAIVWPPVGSSGLMHALLPAPVILVGLWIGIRGFQRRMLVYVLVSSLLSILFFVMFMRATDLFFGHYKGPLQYEIAAAVLAVAGVAANVVWWISAVVNWRRARLPGASKPRLSRTRAITGGIAMTVLLLLTGFIAFAFVPEVPRAMARLEDDVQRRAVDEPRPVREWARLIAETDKPFRRDMAWKMQSRLPEAADANAVPVLIKLLGDEDPSIRRAAAASLLNMIQGSHTYATQPGAGPSILPSLDADSLALMVAALNDDDELTRRHIARALRSPRLLPPTALAATAKSAVPALIGATNRPELEVRTMAVMVLGAMGNNAAEAVPTLIALVERSDSGCSMPALQSLGRIDAEAATIVPFLAGKVAGSPTPSVRSFAARALGELGPAASDALPSLKVAWEKRYLTIEDAQVIYEIDAATAESLHIPKRAPGVGRPPGIGNGPARELLDR